MRVKYVSTDKESAQLWKTDFIEALKVDYWYLNKA